jgi:hypothetical protein
VAVPPFISKGAEILVFFTLLILLFPLNGKYRILWGICPLYTYNGTASDVN